MVMARVEMCDRCKLLPWVIVMVKCGENGELDLRWL